MIVNGDTDFVALKNMKDAMFELRGEFKSNSGTQFKGEFQENFDKRLMLLEHDFDGVMRRVLNLKFMYPNEPARNIDYTKFISEK